jgi:hypothetical protein
VKVTRLPPPHVIAEGDQPQGSRIYLHPESILANDENDRNFINRAQLAIMQVMTGYFS